MPLLKANHERPVELLALAGVSVKKVDAWTDHLLRIGLPDGPDGGSGSEGYSVGVWLHFRESIL